MDGVRRSLPLLLALAGFNLAAWALALWFFQDRPTALVAALVAYGFGLRHAVDPDHIAAIDSATRKLMATGLPSRSTGLFFSLGHSTVVILLCALVAVGSVRLGETSSALRIGMAAGPVISVLFLLLLALLNMGVLRGLLGMRASAERDDARREAEDTLLEGRGLLARVFRRLFNLIRRPSDLFWIGLLFGLGFDTATEIGILGLTAAGNARTTGVLTILILPLLFTAGMALVDTADSAFMTGAYGWALRDAGRRLDYNIAITSVSILVALGVGGIEALGVLGSGWIGGPYFEKVVSFSDDHSGLIGATIVALFALLWAASCWASRRRAPILSLGTPNQPI